MSRFNSLTYCDEINDKLIKWMNETGYTIVQINGQRISSSPRMDSSPSRGCEVFVGKIPRDCYEDELFPVFQRIGPIHELRLMMMFSGTNRGYAFVMYERIQDAQRAVSTLDNYEIRRGHRIGVLPCVNNCRLFLGCFESGERSDVAVQKVLRSETEGVVSITRRVGRNNRWFLLVEYNNHRSAAIARRELTPRRVQLFGPHVVVDWETPMEKRGRRSAIDTRRVLRNSIVMPKCIEDMGYLDDKCPERDLNMRHPQVNLPCMIPPAQIDWMRNTPPPCRAVEHRQHLNGFPQPAYCGSSDGTLVRRPHSSAEIHSKSTLRQDTRCLEAGLSFNNVEAARYHQLICNAQNRLMRSTDSSLYSDPDCQRPLSSDSCGSSISNRSAAGANLPVISWDSSIASGHSTVSSGSSGYSSWDRGACSDFGDANSSDLVQEKRIKAEVGKDLWLSKSWLWQTEDHGSTDINGNRVGGTWSSFPQTLDDFELMNNLFTKESDLYIISSSPCSGIDLQLQALSLQAESKVGKQTFNRTIQPPQSMSGNHLPHKATYLRDTSCNNSIFS